MGELPHSPVVIVIPVIVISVIVVPVRVPLPTRVLIMTPIPTGFTHPTPWTAIDILPVVFRLAPAVVTVPVASYADAMVAIRIAAFKSVSYRRR
jgi:hypothetical protein